MEAHRRSTAPTPFPAAFMRLADPRAGERPLRASVLADPAGLARLSATAGEGWDRGAFILTGAAGVADDLMPRSEFRQWQLIGGVRQKVGGLGLSAAAVHAAASRDGFAEDSGGPRLAQNRDWSIASCGSTRGGWKPSLVNAKTQFRLAASVQRQVTRADTPAIAPGVLDGVPAVTSDTKFRRIEMIADGRTAVSRSLMLVLGAAYAGERVRGNGAIDIGFPLAADFRLRREVASLFGEASIDRGEKIAASLSVRYDDPSGGKGRVGIRWSGRAGLAPGLAVIANAFRSSKMPSLYALGFPLIANPQLKDERARGGDLGLERAVTGGTNPADLFQCPLFRPCRF